MDKLYKKIDKKSIFCYNILVDEELLELILELLSLTKDIQTVIQRYAKLIQSQYPEDFKKEKKSIRSILFRLDNIKEKAKIMQDIIQSQSYL